MKKTKTNAAKSIIRKEDKLDTSKYWIETGIDLEKRRIMLDEDIDDISIGFMVRAIKKMIDINPEEPIDIYIDSYGGCVYSGLSLIDTISSCDQTTIRTHAQGKVMSMALLIYLAGDERYASEYVTFMAHSLSASAIGKLYELQIETNECVRLEKILLQYMADRTDRPCSYWRKTLKYEDKYFDRDVAKTLGIVTNE